MTSYASPIPVKPRLILRAEGAALGFVAILVYAHTGGSWWVLVACLILPDIAMIGYLCGPRVGALCYNLAHSTLAPLAVGGVFAFLAHPWAVPLVAIWGLHIGIDRALGYGLKADSGFTHTHLSA